MEKPEATATFSDADGNRWNLRLTVNAARRVRDAEGVDLLGLIDRPAELERLAGDVVLFVDVLFVIVQPTAESRGITAEQFGEAMRGDAIDDATEAFFRGLIDFFPRSRSKVLSRIFDRAILAKARTTETIDAAIESGEIDEMIDRAIGGGKSSN